MSQANERGAPRDSGHRFVPAKLPNSFEIDANQIELPTIDGGSELDIYCVAWVYRNGRVGDNYCIDYENFQDDRFRNSVNKLIGRAKMSPAMVDGAAEAVEFYYRLSISNRGTTDPVKVFPNWGHDIDKYGATYEAPQRYDLGSHYPSECDFYVGLSLTQIDADGRVVGEPKLKTLLRREDRATKCIENIKKKLIKGKYIPAHLAGKPVSAVHAEVWQRWELMHLSLPKDVR